jgi:hypothetical protein
VRRRGRGRGRGGVSAPTASATSTTMNETEANNGWRACEEGEINEVPVFTGNPGMKVPVPNQTPLDFFSLFVCVVRWTAVVVA